MLFRSCEKIVRFAFELARAEGRRSVACATKSNIMKMTEGTLKRTFEAVAPEYPDIESWHVIVDNCAHQLVKKPEQFDVLVTTNMNGDILSDESSALIGGLGFAPSANIGREVAIFEAVHGSAPKYAGKDVINPTAVILTGVMMLRHIGLFAEAADVEHAVLVTLESGVLTGDIVGYDKGVGTRAYTDAIIGNLGKRSANWEVREYKPIKMPEIDTRADFVRASKREVVGMDVFVEAAMTPAELGPIVEAALEGSPGKLKMISSRGTQVYPATGGAITDTVDQFRCRVMLKEPGELPDATAFEIIQRIGAKVRWMHIEKLQVFDGEPAYTKAQGEN